MCGPGIPAVGGGGVGNVFLPVHPVAGGAAAIAAGGAAADVPLPRGLTVGGGGVGGLPNFTHQVATPAAGCPLLPLMVTEWELTVGGVVDGMLSPCDPFNGTFPLHYVSECRWESDPFSAIGTTAKYVMLATGSELRVFPDHSFGGTGRWGIVGLGAWDQENGGTLTKLSNFLAWCGGWPNTVTVVPVPTKPVLPVETYGAGVADVGGLAGVTSGGGGAGDAVTELDVVETGDLGPYTPGAASTEVQSGSGSQSAWSFPDNATTADDVYALVRGENGEYTDYLWLTDFGVDDLPDGQTVQGITVEIDRTIAASHNVYKDQTVRLIVGGVLAGDNKANTGDTWPTSEATATYGGESDDWGIDWESEDVTASDFGVAIAVSRSSTGNPHTAMVDVVRVTVHYG